MPIQAPETEAAAPARQRGQQLVRGVEVVRHLHRSRHNDVYEVIGPRDVAAIAKVVRPDLGSRPRAHARLVREGQLLAGGGVHPNIVRVLRAYEQPGALLLERLAGVTLRARLQREHSLAAPELRELARDVAGALAHLHARGVLHADVKPANVMHVPRRGWVLIDFDLAREFGEVRRGVGTRGYAAPEQVRGGLLDGSADVWGLGALLVRAAGGRERLDAELAALVMAMLYENAAPRPSAARVASVAAGLCVDLADHSNERLGRA